MIVWINGTFGVGKTTTGAALRDQTGWRMFDPEHVGYLLAANLKDHEFDDFQDLPPWRTLVPVVAEEVFRYTRSDVMLAVQTVLTQDYWKELKVGLESRGLSVHHVVLRCETEELKRRIETDEVESQAREWRLDHVDRFESALGTWMADAADLVVDTTDLDPEAVARSIAESTTERRSTQ